MVEKIIQLYPIFQVALIIKHWQIPKPFPTFLTCYMLEVAKDWTVRGPHKAVFRKPKSLIKVTRTCRNDIKMSPCSIIRKGRLKLYLFPRWNIKIFRNSTKRFNLHICKKKSLKKIQKEIYIPNFSTLSCNSKNLFVAINSRAVSVLTYSFGIIKYSDAELNKLDRMAPRILVSSGTTTITQQLKGFTCTEARENAALSMYINYAGCIVYIHHTIRNIHLET